MEGASFYHNVLLLMQVIPPSKDFLKYFKEGMFDKPNTVGFIHVSHYLLTIYNLQRFKKTVQWPVMCKKTEAKYRTDVKDLLISVAHENSDVEFPQILASHLLHAGGSKFCTIMWKLSVVALRTHIERGTGNVLLCPKPGEADGLGKKFFNNLIDKSDKNIREIDGCMTKNLETAYLRAKQLADSIQDKQDNLLQTRDSLLKLAAGAPAHPAMKKRLADPYDMEVIKMWQTSNRDQQNYLKSKHKRLKEIEDLCRNVSDIIESIALPESHTLDGDNCPKIDIQVVSEIYELTPQAEIALGRLYVNGTLVLESFYEFLTLVLSKFHRNMEKYGFHDFADCEPQANASCEDMKLLTKCLRGLLDEIMGITNDLKKSSSRENVLNRSWDAYQNPRDNNLFDSVLLKSSPTVHINGNNEPERTDQHDRLELTPIENLHKALFSRHKRQEEAPSLKRRVKFAVSRINFDDTASSCTSPRMSPANRGASSLLINDSVAIRSGKYSRLFNYQKKSFNRFNSTLMSNQGNNRARGRLDMNATCDVYNVSELRPHLVTKNKFTDIRSIRTPPKVLTRERNASLASSTINDEAFGSQSMITVSKTVIDETTEFKIALGSSPDEKKETTNRRVSISDLVERYRKLHEKSIDVAAYIENSDEAFNEIVKQ